MNPNVWVAHLVVEALSPLAIGTGQGDELRDALFAATPLGLPYLPATSLTGVLRSHIHHDFQSLFGVARSSQRDDQSSESINHDVRSKVWLANGLVHNKHNQPQPLLPKSPDFKGDEVLRALALGVTRDHVRIGMHGAVDGRGKFDDTAVMAGARFSFQLRLEAPSGDGREQEALRALLTRPLRVGGKTRRGYGKLAAVAGQCWERSFDLTKPADREAWSRWVEGAAPKPGKDGWVTLKAKSTEAPDGPTVLRLQLQAIDHLVFGGGHSLPEALQAEFADRELPSRTPWTEQRLSWHNDTAKLEDKPLPVLPGTGIKGALRHRTAFHLRRIHPEGDAEKRLESLFGSCSDSTDGAEEKGTPGKLFVDDVVLKPSDWQRAEAHKHVSLDRFTGGPMPGLLFDDITLVQPRFDLTVELAKEASAADGGVKAAFIWALRDLLEGRLGLGAGQNAGYGFVRLAEPAAWAGLKDQLRTWNGGAL